MNARLKVLIVDSQEDVLISLEWLLENEGFDTTTAWSGMEALRAATAQAFNLVLMADYLPDLDAEEFMRKLRHVRRDVPCVVMLSGKTKREPGWMEPVAMVHKRSQDEVLNMVRTQLRRGPRTSLPATRSTI